MHNRLKNKIKTSLKAIKQSPINFATLGLKDPQLNKQFQMKQEL
jgi:hypothetical protein